ncbi:hypothetical protein C8R45DRAFT_927038 [Mycena sanguinolenta]|nr:hypothetical protein C8R45DRAFT_927038 [Mycena sanguinolenta]
MACLTSWISKVTSSTRLVASTLSLASRETPLRWVFLAIVSGSFSLASPVNAESGHVKFISYDISNPSPLFMQAIANTSNGITFDVNCLSSTTGTFTNLATGLALTAWPAESGSVPSPITYETLTGRPQQNWTFEALD